MAFESEEVEHLLIISLEFPIADSMACFKESIQKNVIKLYVLK